MNIRQMSIFKDECNYGQRLQEYALQKFIKKYFGYDIYLYDTLNFCENKTSTDNVKLSLFKKFEKEYLNIVKFQSDNYNNVDYFICGSDMVFNWNQLITKNERYYFTFDFLKKYDNIITYSVSFPPSIVKNYKNIYSKLNKLNCISVREYCNINELFNIHIYTPLTYNIDPVFLLSKEEWLNISKKPEFVNKDEYNFVYITYKDVIEFNNSYYCTVKHNKKYPLSSLIGPCEFIWLLNNASYIYTNSYHMYCFSLIFNKPCKLVYDNNYRFENLDKNISFYNTYDNFIDVEKNRTINYFKKNLNYD